MIYLALAGAGREPPRRLNVAFPNTAGAAGSIGVETRPDAKIGALEANPSRVGRLTGAGAAGRPSRPGRRCAHRGEPGSTLASAGWRH
ncbi:MAG: hypothetical protein GTO28_15165 [Gammaproteobacteria bacterium]|nr:hypothetical protein [Gammaproteobacteria bacterium]NIQ27884.1 hypothetical protein [Gammaproteobacteria bacterium]NIR21019.1 hypothetical protein [Gammaproteobacteria bacterium]